MNGITCPAGHWFNGPIESLTRQDSQTHDSGHAAIASRAGPVSFTAAMMAWTAAAGSSGIPRGAGWAIRSRRPGKAPGPAVITALSAAGRRFVAGRLG